MAQETHSESTQTHPEEAWQVALVTWLQVRTPRVSALSGPQGSLQLVYVVPAGQLP